MVVFTTWAKVQPRVFFGDDRSDVEDALRLALDVPVDQLSGTRVERDLAAEEDEA